MKRRTLFLIALACLTAFALGVVPWSVSPERQERQLARHVRAITGLNLSVKGRTTFALLPVPRIKLEDVTLATASGEILVRARQLRGELQTLPLVTGVLNLADLTLHEPVISTGLPGPWQWPDGEAPPAPLSTAQAGPQGAWTPTVQRLVREIDRGRAADDGRHISRVVITRGRLVRGPLDGSEEPGAGRDVVRDINGVIGWASTTSPISIAGQGIWRDRPVDISLSGPTPSAFRAGQASDVDLRIKSGASTLTAQGALSDPRRPTFAGYVRLSTDSLSEIDRWLGARLGLARAIEDFSIAGPATISPRGAAISPAAVTIGQDALEGAMNARFDGRRTALSGTFAASTLDIGRFLRDFAPGHDGAGNWSEEPLEQALIARSDLDLRLSATEATIGRLKLNDLAASVLAKAGRIELTLNQATCYKGTLKGKVVVAPQQSTQAGVHEAVSLAPDAAYDARLQASLDRVDVTALSSDMLRTRLMSGTAAGQFNLETSGASVADLARNLGGKVHVAVRQGEVTGVDLAEALRRTERRPLSAGLDWRGGRTLFDQLTLGFQIADGAAEIADASLQNDALKAALSGRVLVGERAYDLRGSIVRTGGAESLSLPFELTGSWDEPRWTPDIKALIRRSGAAAPLLERFTDGFRQTSAQPER